MKGSALSLTATSIFGLFFLAVSFSPAQAALKLCNRTSYILYTATGQPQRADLQIKGWSRIIPGSCITAIDTPLTAAKYYAYAQTSRAHMGVSRAWGGDEALCVKQGNFNIRKSPLPGCDDTDAFEVSFRTLQPRGKKNLSQNFTERADYDTLSKARMAGLQRLLSDSGYQPGALTGAENPTTEKALSRFRTTARLTSTSSDEALFKALEHAAARHAAPSGYSICNSTTTPLWAAIALKDAKGYASRGWWKIPAMHCATAINEALKQDQIHLLVDQPGKAPLVTGPTKFCVTDIAFEIQGNQSCEKRGLRSMGFAATHTKNQAGYVARIGPKGLLPPQPRISK